MLRAVNPIYAVRFFTENGFTGFLALGSVFLVVTGGEALYADMGHFGRRADQARRGSRLVLPALLLNYFGQGALLIADHDAIESPFFKLAPAWALYPLVVLATMATIIASQALISGVFSLTIQAIQLGYVAPAPDQAHVGSGDRPDLHPGGQLGADGGLHRPGDRLRVVSRPGGGLRRGGHLHHGHHDHPLLRRAPRAVRVAAGRAAGLCGRLPRRSTSPSSAPTCSRSRPAVGSPSLVVGAMFSLMTTWRTGRRLVADAAGATTCPCKELVAGIGRSPELSRRVPGTAVYLFSTPGLAPPALVANIRHNKALHERVIVMSVVTAPEPRVLPARRVDAGRGGPRRAPGDPPLRLHGGARRARRYLARERRGRSRPQPGPGHLLPRSRGPPGHGAGRDGDLAGAPLRRLSRNATPAAVYFNLPLPQTITLGTAIEL